MAFLKQDEPLDESDAGLEVTPRQLCVEGVVYRNSAAKFWVGLLDEAIEQHPRCQVVELSATSSELLNGEHLDPSIAFAKSLEHLLVAGENLSDLMTQTLEEVSMFGPPAPVRLRLLDGEDVLHDDDLSTECIDEEILSCMLVWLLEWSRLPEAIWNHGFVHGTFAGEDSRRERRYDVSFDLKNEHLSEGLFRRTCRVSVTSAPYEPA